MRLFDHEFLIWLAEPDTSGRASRRPSPMVLADLRTPASLLHDPRLSGTSQVCVDLVQEIVARFCQKARDVALERPSSAKVFARGCT